MSIDLNNFNNIFKRNRNNIIFDGLIEIDLQDINISALETLANANNFCNIWEIILKAHKQVI
jgi:hypothetical protein